MGYERWETYGKELRQYREKAKLTQRGLAAKAGLSHGMIGLLERGERAPKADYSDIFDTVLATDGVLSRVYRDISGRRDVPDWFKDALMLERRSMDVWEWEPLAVPGLLQTEAYARALDSGRRLKPDPDAVERVVTTRTTRLAGMTERKVVPTLIVAEGVLNYVVGDREVMRKQVQHLAALADAQKVLLQILRSTAPPLVLGLPFRIIKLERTTVAYVEHANGGLIIDNPLQVSHLSARFMRLTAEAMSPGDSRQLLETLGNRDELANE